MEVVVLLDVAQSALLVVDVQERLAAAVSDRETCLARCRTLIQAARHLAVPVVASEQYPKGLGATVAAVAELLEPEEIQAKRHFSCAADPALAAALRDVGRAQIVICGMEAHVCVLQTALGLQADGLRPVVVADAVASRRPETCRLALDRLRASGVEIVDTEMVVFEWLREAGTPAFRALAPLIR
jgi:nicotinamidase-related amidase